MEAPAVDLPRAEPGKEAPPPAEASRASEDGRLRPGAKRVTFPSDEDIVSGAVEPKDPWRHGNGGGGGVGTGFGSRRGAAGRGRTGPAGRDLVTAGGAPGTAFPQNYQDESVGSGSPRPPTRV